jgi:hypothetical protein
MYLDVYEREANTHKGRKEANQHPTPEIKTEEDLLPPGALPGTVPTDLEQATGLERLEILGKMEGVDIFDMKPLDASRKGRKDSWVQGGSPSRPSPPSRAANRNTLPIGTLHNLLMAGAVLFFTLSWLMMSDRC